MSFRSGHLGGLFVIDAMWEKPLLIIMACIQAICIGLENYMEGPIAKKIIKISLP